MFKVGVIGLGDMGSGLAKNLIKKKIRKMSNFPDFEQKSKFRGFYGVPGIREVSRNVN